MKNAVAHKFKRNTLAIITSKLFFITGGKDQSLEMSVINTTFTKKLPIIFTQQKGLGRGFTAKAKI